MSEPVRILIGDVLDGLRTLDAGSVQCCVTSPPYWGLRDYGVDGQIGLEPTPEAFVAKMVEVFREVRRVLREDGVCFLNIGDSYATGTTANRQQSPNPGVGANCPEAQNSVARIGTPAGLKTKDLCMIPWRVALALQADGWYLRSVIVWAKKSPMPESVTDRPTSSWEPIFLLAKGERYFYDAEAVKEQSIHAGAVVTNEAGKNGDMGKYGATRTGFMKEGGVEVAATRNQRNVWHLGPEPYKESHFACFPTEIPRRAILAGTSEKGACPDCGAPWKRITTREKLTRERPNDFTKRDGEEGTGNSCANTVAGVATTTLGWEPTCKCGNPNTVPCVVLDPFLGSGTTIAVARTLGRHGVGCELNPAYAELARERIGKAEKPSTFVSEKAHEAPLFT
jgi:DNA modification methylase